MACAVLENQVQVSVFRAGGSQLLSEIPVQWLCEQVEHTHPHVHMEINVFLCECACVSPHICESLHACEHVCGGQRLILGVFLYTETGSLPVNMKLSLVVLWGSPVPTSPHRDYTLAVTPAWLLCGTQACTASTLSTKPSPQL